MELGWEVVAQAVAIAVCTWYVRRGSKRDSEKASSRVIRSTAAQSTSNDILARMKKVERDLALVKMAITGDNGGIDDRGPRED